MTPVNENEFDDEEGPDLRGMIYEANATKWDKETLTFEKTDGVMCDAGDRHCHQRRSLRQEGSVNDRGERLVCHRPAGWGTNHSGEGPCKLHAGNTPGVQKSVRLKKLKEEVATLGLPRDVAPPVALMEELHRTAGVVSYLENLIRNMEVDSLVYGLVEETASPDVLSETGYVVSTPVTGKWAAKTHPLYQMYMENRKHYLSVSEAAIKAGVTVQMAETFQQVADTYMRLIDRIVSRLELPEEKRRILPTIIMQELKALVPTQE